MKLRRLKKKVPAAARRTGTTTKNKAPEVKAAEPEGQLHLALAIPDPQGPMFGSSFLELARDCQLPLGTRGSVMLSQLRHLEKAIELFRQRYRHQLGQDPSSVPGWTLSKAQVRELASVAAAFKRVEDRPVIQDMLLDAARVRLTELEKAICALQGEGALERIFGDLIGFHEITRLVEVKGFKAWQQQKSALEGEESGQ